MNAKPLKSKTTYAEQLALIKGRGCLVENDERAIICLGAINYYRLTAYFLPFRNPKTGKYTAHVSFDQIMGIYSFDQALRFLLGSVIEDIEIFLRATLAYYHSHKYGPLGYEEESYFEPRFDWSELVQKINRDKLRRKESRIYKHHRATYGGKFPLWVIVEFFSLGTLNYFIKGLKPEDKTAIASVFQTDSAHLNNWLAILNDLRNLCAHGGRLYYGHFSKHPTPPSNEKFNEKKKNSLFAQLLLLKWLYPDRQKWDTSIVPQLRRLVEAHSKHIRLSHMGFSNIWWKELNWSHAE
jgi:Abortive infection bacteriophage resistance protein